MTARTIAENGGENNLKKQYLKERQMKDYPEEYDQENLDNQYLAEAFPDAKGLGDLYRQTYTIHRLWALVKCEDSIHQSA
jgi:hypothetical protein